MEKIKFGQLFAFQKKTNLKASEEDIDGKFPFYTSSSVISKRTNNPIYNKISLIIGNGGSANIHYADVPFSATSHCYIAVANTSDVNTKFVYFYLSNNLHILERGFKGAGLKNISSKYVEEIEIPLPDLETQNKIVAILDKAKAILDKREKTIKKYDELLRATFLEMFGDVAFNPNNYRVSPLKEFGEVITGNTPLRSESENYNSQFIEWIKTDNIVADSPNLTQASEYLSEQGFSRARFVDENALLVACIAGSLSSIGRAAISDRRVAFNQQINAIVPSSDVSVHFLYWLFKVSADYIQSFATGGMKKLLTKGEFEKIPLIKPNYQEQLKFENIALFYTQLSAKLKKHHFQVEQLLKSLSQQVFNERITIDVDTELNALLNAIDLEKKDDENKIETIKGDITYVQRLLDRINGHDFILKDDYDKAQYVLFRILKEEKNLIKQILKDGKIVLTLQNEVN